MVRVKGRMKGGRGQGEDQGWGWAKLTRRTICVVSKSRTDWGFLRSWLGSGLGEGCWGWSEGC